MRPASATERALGATDDDERAQFQLETIGAEVVEFARLRRHRADASPVTA